MSEIQAIYTVDEHGPKVLLRKVLGDKLLLVLSPEVAHDIAAQIRERVPTTVGAAPTGTED